MNLSHPGFLAALGLLVPVLIAFMVRRQRNVLRVPSTMIWRLGAQSVVKSRRIKNLRRLLALALCLLGVAAFALAAARPSAGVRGDFTVFVVDTSASMAGTPIRDAKRWLTRERSSMGPSAYVAIVTAGGTARVALPMSRPGVTFDQAVAKLVAEPEASAMDEAIALADGLAGVGPARVVVLSDEPVDADVSRLPNRTTSKVFARPARDNVGITSLYTRGVPESQDEDQREATVSVASSSNVARHVRFTLTQAGTVVADRTLDVPPRGDVAQRVSIRGGGLLSARIEPIDGVADALSIDDEASLEQPPRRLLRVALVSGAPAAELEAIDGVSAFFVEKALRAAGIESLTQARANDDPPKEVVDVAVVLTDGPGRPRDVPQFFIGAAPGDLGIVARDVGANEAKLRSIATDDMLLRGVSLDDLTVMRAKVAPAPRGARVLVDLDGGPTLLAGGTGSHAWVWLGIDPQSSDLVLRVPFPVLVGNVLTHLGGLAQSVAAKTLPRSEVMLRAPDIAKPLPPAAEPRWRMPVSPPVVLGAIGALLLAMEAWLSLRSARNADKRRASLPALARSTEPTRADHATSTNKTSAGARAA